MTRWTKGPVSMLDLSMTNFTTMVNCSIIPMTCYISLVKYIIEALVMSPSWVNVSLTSTTMPLKCRSQIRVEDQIALQLMFCTTTGITTKSKNVVLIDKAQGFDAPRHLALLQSQLMLAIQCHL